MVVTLSSVRLPLAHFDLEVSAEITGRVTGLFGPSGAGKTTLLELIAGLRLPESGRIALHGHDVTGVPPRDRHIGLVPQDDSLFPHLSVARNIRYGSTADAARLEQILEVLEVRPLLRRAIRGLSGGERKRVALARALATTPRLLLLDEPLAGVDHPLRERVLVYLRRVRDEFETPMIYVSHDPAEVQAICDEVLVMERGRVVARQ